MNAQLHCPACGSDAVGRVVWGLPDPWGEKRLIRQGAIFGSCDITLPAPDLGCRKCGEMWSSDDRGDDAISEDGGDRAGSLAIEAINTIRRAHGFDEIGGLRFKPCDHRSFGCLDCALGEATRANLRFDRDEGSQLDFGDPGVAARTAAALGLEHQPGGTSIPLTAELESLVLADAFDLTFRDRDGMLVGWAEPNDLAPRLWDLHLCPGRDYPPGHEPAGR